MTNTLFARSLASKKSFTNSRTSVPGGKPGCSRLQCAGLVKILRGLEFYVRRDTESFGIRKEVVA